MSSAAPDATKASTAAKTKDAADEADTPQAPKAISRPTAVALGYFDGVHLGHRRILRAAADWGAAHGAAAVGFTFQFGARRTKGADILTPTERRRRMLAQGLEQVVSLPFDEIAALPPAQFVQQVLAAQLGARAVFCGENFRFGAGAAGDVPLLRRLCAPLGIQVFAFPLESRQGAPVSSTRIRALLADGRLEAANALLGEPYALDLPVSHGQGLGADLGWPTINQLYPPDMERLAEGVYRTVVLLDGRWLPGATGLGSRPTVTGPAGAAPNAARLVTCETFLCRWQGDAYGSCPRVCFLEYLWPVRRYDSLDGLKDCIARAAAQSTAAFDAGLWPGAPLPGGEKGAGPL